MIEDTVTEEKGRTRTVPRDPEHIGLPHMRRRVPAVLWQPVLVLEVLRVQRRQAHPGPPLRGGLVLGIEVRDGERGGGLAPHVERAQEEREEHEAGDAEHEVAAGEEAQAQQRGVGLCVEAARVLAGRREHGGRECGGDGGEREGAGGECPGRLRGWRRPPRAGWSRSLMVFSSNAQTAQRSARYAGGAVLPSLQFWRKRTACWQSAHPSNLGISLRCRLCCTVRMCLLDGHFRLR